jgi:lysophospholipase L1-like esterase
MLANNEISFDNNIYKGYGYVGYNSTNAIEIDTVNKKFRVITTMSIVYHHTAANIAVQDWQTYSESSTGYLKTVYVDLTDNTIKISVNSVISNPHIILFHFTGAANVINGNIFGPTPNITGVTVNGVKTVENRPIYIGQIGYGTYNNIIEIDLINAKIRLNSSLWVMSNGLNINVSAHDWNPFVAGTNVNYVLVCYVDLSTNKLCITNHSAILNNAIILFRFQGATATYKSHYSSSSFSVLINSASIVFSAGDSSSADTFFCSNNKFVIPETLYLVKGLEYGINPQNFNYNKVYSTDLLDFEIPLPTRTEQFSKYGKISVPFSGNFLTKVVGKYRKDDTNALYKDILLKVKDIADITTHSVKALYVGDSIVNGNLPKILKYWLGKFGITATMLGTINNEIDYGYGIQPPLSVEKGEGRGGWRLTDFAETTRYVDGTTDVLHSPFWNPNTGLLDFQYYLTQYNIDVPDIVIIALGTNDISGYHNKSGAIAETIDDQYNTIIERDLKVLIDVFKAVNPNVKVAINPPMSNGLDTVFAQRANRWAEKEQLIFEDNANYLNVYCLGSYLSSAWISAPTYQYTSNPAPTQPDPNNKTMKTNFINNVHQNGMGQLQNALWVASWIANII